MRTILLLLIMLCGLASSQVKAQNDSLFNYKEEYTEHTLKRYNKTYRSWGIKITPKFEANPCVGKRAGLLTGYHEHPDFIGNVDSTYQAFFSVPKWKEKLKKMQEADKTLRVSINFYVNPSGEVLYSYFYFHSREKQPRVADWFTEEELLELYMVCKKIKYNLSELTVVYTGFEGSRDEDYFNRNYEYIRPDISLEKIREKMIKAGTY